MWQSLPAGEVLVREGDAGECMWFVVRGRLRVSARQTDGAARVVGEIGAGECVGEMALLSQAPRAATVKVVRDAELLRLAQVGFRPAGRRSPGGHAAARARHRRSSAADAGSPSRASSQSGRSRSSRQGRTSLSRHSRTCSSPSSREWHGPSSWTGRRRRARPRPAPTRPPRSWCSCATPRRRPGRRGASARRTTWWWWPAPTVTRARDRSSRKRWPSAGRREAGCHLVLLQPSGSPPARNERVAGGTARRAPPPRPSGSGRRSRPPRAAALGAGHRARPCRGEARAASLTSACSGRCSEAGVPVDVVAGTSMGAMIGAVHALGHAPDAILDRCRAWTRERPWSDFTLPLASIVRGRRMRRALDASAGRRPDRGPLAALRVHHLEPDARHRRRPHRRGRWCAWCWPPTRCRGWRRPSHYLGDVHVDGGVMDNLPVGVLRGMGAGRVIAVDVGTELHVTAPAGARRVPERVGPPLGSASAPSRRGSARLRVSDAGVHARLRRAGASRLSRRGPDAASPARQPRGSAISADRRDCGDRVRSRPREARFVSCSRGRRPGAPFPASSPVSIVEWKPRIFAAARDRIRGQHAAADGGADALAHVQGGQSRGVAGDERVPLADGAEALPQVVAVPAWSVGVAANEARLVEPFDELLPVRLQAARRWRSRPRPMRQAPRSRIHRPWARTRRSRAGSSRTTTSSRRRRAKRRTPPPAPTISAPRALGLSALNNVR